MALYSSVQYYEHLLVGLCSPSPCQPAAGLIDVECDPVNNWTCLIIVIKATAHCWWQQLEHLRSGGHCYRRWANMLEKQGEKHVLLNKHEGKSLWAFKTITAEEFHYSQLPIFADINCNDI